ncbi:MAG: hypothetical protein ACP5HC_02370 [Caldisericum sp.]
MEQNWRVKMETKEYELFKKALKEDSDGKALEELAKIPQEIIDKEAAQKYIKWKLKSETIASIVVGTILFLIIGSILLFAGIYSIYSMFHEKDVKKDEMLIWAIGSFFLLLLITIGYISDTYEHYLRYKILKKNEEKNLN